MARTGRYCCYEYFGDGDPMFGGAADDRTLGKDGRFLTRSHTWKDHATFATAAEAKSAGERAPNKREGGLISTGEEIVPDWVTGGEYCRAMSGAA